MRTSMLLSGDMLAKLKETMLADNAAEFGVVRKLNNFFSDATCVKIDQDMAIAEKKEEPSYEIDFRSREYRTFAGYFLDALKKLEIVKG